MNYRVRGLSPDPFESLFQMTDDELAERGAVRRVADEPHAFPCRVSLAEAEPGEELLLLPYRHQTSASPYQASARLRVLSASVIKPMPVIRGGSSRNRVR